MSLRNPKPQGEVCKVLPGVIAGYMEQSEELKTYFHCIIKACKGREEAAQGAPGPGLVSTWPWGILALLHFLVQRGTGPAVILQLDRTDSTADVAHPWVLLLSTGPAFSTGKSSPE